LARFVLVHGGYHGAWCWSKVTPQLEALGHEAVEVDLPGAGERVDEKATISSWRQAVTEVIEDGDILVGHSMGGYVISMAADEVPEKVGGLIYLAAAAPLEGQSMRDATPIEDHWKQVTGMEFDEYARVSETPAQGPVLELTNKRAADQIFYHDCSPEDQQWAFERLTPLPVDAISTPLTLPRFWQASIPRDFIVCTDDRSHPIAWDNEFMKRLGVSTCFGICSSHSPFISHPSETARLLQASAVGALH
jgi:pimeloyl-ACP methyl ester carboxylesterase